MYYSKTAVSSYQRDLSGLFEVLLNLKCFPVCVFFPLMLFMDSVPVLAE